jgi:DNA-binding NtrC family response regulator
MDRRRTVLLVERNPRSRFVLRTALRRLGFRVIAARSRAEALDVTEHGTPDVVLMDDPADGGVYRIVSLPNARSEDVSVRLVGLREAPPLGPKPVRLADVLSAIEEMVPGAERASA